MWCCVPGTSSLGVVLCAWDQLTWCGAVCLGPVHLVWCCVPGTSSLGVVLCACWNSRNCVAVVAVVVMYCCVRVAVQVVMKLYLLLALLGWVTAVMWAQNQGKSQAGSLQWCGHRTKVSLRQGHCSGVGTEPR